MGLINSLAFELSGTRGIWPAMYEAIVFWFKSENRVIKYIAPNPFALAHSEVANSQASEDQTDVAKSSFAFGART